MVKWLLSDEDDFAQAYQKLGVEIYNDDDYQDGMNIITDFRDTQLPKLQIYYNNMTSKIKIKGQAHTAVRLFNKSQSEYKQLLDIFHIFYKGKEFFQSIKTVYSVSEAFEVLGLSEYEDELKSFLE